MRTPSVMIVGLVLGPCGLLLNLVSTLTPCWRQVSSISGKPIDVVYQQGIWELCQETQSTRQRQCGLADELGYFPTQPVQVAKGLMVSSLVVTVLGLVVAALGVRCWQEEPHYLLAGLSGLILFASGLMSLIPVSWYNHYLSALPAPTGSTLEVGYSLVLGYLGSCLELIGGFSLALSLHQCCQECRRKKTTTKYPHHSQPGPATVSSRDFMPRSQKPAPKSFSNPVDVLEGERSISRSLPCDSDL
ncbi:claudin-23 [Chelonoidis abingdonii]|uniref:Claudin 23 n=1 Tax=Chelonoidis abingdonii TaxID=106734 RepID=A0A8C0GT88_CHEAB|nr:claudin-23 [Chelonoidis abingdonii]